MNKLLIKIFTILFTLTSCYVKNTQDDQNKKKSNPFALSFNSKLNTFDIFTLNRIQMEFFNYQKTLNLNLGSLDFKINLIKSREFPNIEKLTANSFEMNATNYNDLVNDKIKFWKNPIFHEKGGYVSIPPDFEFKYSSEIIFESNRIICLRLDLIEYTGGVHPYYKSEFIIFDKLKNKRIDIFDLIKRDRVINFWKIAEGQFWTQIPIEKLFEFKFTRSENIGIDYDGLIFHYDRYEIAPYSSGEIEYFVSFAELHSILEKKF